jgi:glycosyltransferase 2 family protein
VAWGYAVVDNGLTQKSAGNVPGGRVSDRSWVALWISVAIGIIGYLGFSLWVGWADVTSALSRVGLIPVIAALGFSSFNYSLRFVRWQYFLRVLRHRVPAPKSLLVYLAGFGLTTTPGKAGEALRSLYLKPHGVTYPESLAALFAERFSDLLSVLLLVCLGLWLYPPARPVVLGVGILLAVALFTIQFPSLWAFILRGQNRRIRHAATMFTHIRSCLQPRVFSIVLVFSVAGWAAEGFAFFYILHALGADVSLHQALFIFSFAMLVGAISFLPGGLGGTELTLVGLLMLNAVGEGDAVAATVLIRLTTLWYSVLIGGICILALRREKVHTS